jgi:hypothetical protein
MDNKQLRTAMVTKALSKTPMDSLTGSYMDVATEVFEMSEKAQSWRKTVGLNMSIAARGSREGSWYVDLIVNPQSGWRELLINMHSAMELLVCAKKPSKVLFFNPDIWSSPFLQKNDNQDISVNFVNNQSLYNYEQFLRDDAMQVGGKSYRDIDYGVCTIDEIGKNLCVNFDFIQMMGFEAMEDLSIAESCISALSPGGMLVILFSNNSGKLYRDDYWFHPMNEIHELLKKSEGYTFHSSEAYGYTVFVKT